MVDEGLDVNDDLFAHLNAAFNRGRTHMREGHDTFIVKKATVDLGFVLKYVETRTSDLTIFYGAGECFLIYDIASCGVDDEGGWFEEFKAAR